MKRIITLLLLFITAFNLTPQAQTGTVCNADFSFQYLSVNTVKFTPVVIGDSINTQHYWNLGNGSLSSSAIVTNTYSAAGTYSILHVIKKYNPNGVLLCTDSISKQIIIQSVPCNLQANFNFYDSIGLPLTIKFVNLSQNVQITDSVRWTFGDGTVLNGIVSNYNTFMPAHTYATAGTYTVCLRIKRNSASGTTTPCISEFCKTVVVVATSPCNIQANFIGQPNATQPLRLSFTNLSTPVVAADSVIWTFGDGTSIRGLQGDSNIANPTHLYAQPGTYTVCIKIKKAGNSIGATPCVKEYCKTFVVVQSSCNFQVNFTKRQDSITANKVHFTNFTAVITANAIAKWSFGDGSYSNSWHTTHTYAQPGTYIVCLTVQTSPNCIKQKCDTIIIAPVGPTCKDLSKFKFEKFATDNQKYKFTPDYIGNDIQYTWTFGDGTGSKDPVSTHRYAQPGIYTACLTAWRGPNCASTTCKEIRVLPQINCDSINVSFTWRRDSSNANKVYFYSNSNYPLLDQIWTITKLSPAGTLPVILRQNNPAYVFADSGTYKVCLRAITLGGCIKEYCAVIRIENNAPACLLQAYPNPATTVINIAVPLVQPELIRLYVYNSSNILVREKSQQGVAGINIVTVNTATLPAGLYTVKALYGNKICYARFTKQ